ncbi:MAG: Gfo/Idh/MocA family oxidoreductase [Prolixibacteraceae bacterium]|nr:Gfo/Idh/MocA family oxidoreductase [Prolixibacteraceae bacterium]
MKNKRRDFIKLTGLTGIGLAGGTILNGYASGNDNNIKPDLVQHSKKMENSHVQSFNMSGYAAPKLETIRVGIIGLGGRGMSPINNLKLLEGVKINALCDLIPERASRAKKILEGTGHNPDTYSGDEKVWKQLCEREDIDLVIVTTPWYLHAEMAVYAMEQGKHTATEVVLGATLEECWQVVETAERTRKHCMMMANTSYSGFPLLTLNMARHDFFGELIHGECGYIANKIKNNFRKDGYWDMWWLKQYANRKGNIYPIHGFCWVAQIMDINRGDKMVSLVSVESEDFIMSDKAKKLAIEDELFKQFVDKDFRGNINTTVIKTAKGRTITIQHDASTPRPHSYIHGIYGSKRCAVEYPHPPRISDEEGSSWISQEEYKALEEKYTPVIVKKIGEISRQVGGHGGIDFMLYWRMIDCLHNGLPLDMDVYDGVSLSSIVPLSEWSVNNGSSPIDIPDFTAGAWKTNKRNMDINLERGGGNTKVKF